MMLLVILFFTLIVSLVSLVGIFSLLLKDVYLKRILLALVAFSAGTLIGGAFLHLLPEAIDLAGGHIVVVYTLFGFLLFFLLERYLHWRHCHNGVCDVHAFTYLNLVGDSVHNFIDGLAIAASFMTDMKLGLVTTLVIICHEVPQEIGDFAVLVYGGFSKARALTMNLLVALTAMLGALLGYFMASAINNFSVMLMSLTAGGFIYVGSCDLIPELHRETDSKKANISMIIFLLGIIFMWGLKKIL